MLISFKHYRSSFRRAFTLIELLVVVGIITVITGFVLLQQAKFNSSTVMRSLAYSVALTIRQAQVYGVSVRAVSGSATFAPGYGVYFNNPTNYKLFADTSNASGNSGVFDGGDTVVKTFNLNSGYNIVCYCGILNSTTAHCSAKIASYADPNGYCPVGSGALTWLMTYFKRPNPDATITSSAAEAYLGAYVVINSGGNNDVRAIKVSTAGQISVCALNSNPLTC
jgi:prepilin-type N-terminal cleavage/methylation domain-containing protein